jgi:PBSX family phage terminase large subunit
VLPHQRELIEAPEKYVALVGGYGAGKSVPAAILGVLLSLQVDGNSGIVLRRSYPKLHDSTERIVLEVLQRLNIEFRSYEQRDGWPHRIVLPNQSEIAFRETKEVGRFLGPEYGWFWIDEAAEEPKKTWTDLVGRLRLPQARRYLKGFLTTNPPHHQHWIPELFGTVPGVTKVGKASYRLIRVSSRLNPYLPESYIDDLRANNPESEVKRIIEGEYGFVFEGKAVYMPPFDFSRHVRKVEPLIGYMTVRAWDFGYHVPAVTWHQFPKCAEGKVHWRLIHEYIGKDIEAEDLARLVLDETNALLAADGDRTVLDCGDAAGAQVSDKGPGPIIRLRKKPYNLNFRYRHLPNIDPGLALVREALRSADCGCGQPMFVIDRGCRHAIDGFAGGYHYPTFRPGRPATDTVLKPVKDGFYDNVMDTIRYAAECYYRGLSRDPDLLRRLMADQARQETTVLTGPASPWGWMEGDRGV